MHTWIRRTAIRAARVASVAALVGAEVTAGSAQEGRGAVVGTVVARATGTPLVAARVRAADLAREVETDANGRFELHALPPGPRELTVRAIGYEPATLRVIVAADRVDTVAVALDERAVLLSDVIVSVSREAQSRAEATASIGVVDRSELERSGAHHPAGVVSRVAGAWVTNMGGEGHFTAIRQPITTKPVYAYLEDGIPIRSTGFFNHNALYEVNLPQAERVEVIKGPGTALYGSDAIGGVVNSFTRGPSADPTGEILLEGGRFGYARALLSASNTWGADGLRAEANITRSDSWRDGAPYSRQSGSLRWDRRLGRAELRTLVSASHIDQPGDGGSDVTALDLERGSGVNYSPIAFRRVLALRASSTLEQRTGLGLASATLYTRYNELDLMPSWQLAFDPQIWETRHRSAGLLARYRRLVPALRLNLSAGLDLEASPGSRLERRIVPEQQGGVFRDYAEGEVQYDYDVTFWQVAPYVQAQVTPIDRLRVDLGLRLDHVGYDYDSRLPALATGTHRRPPSGGVSYQHLSPKVGVTLEMARGLHAYASYRAAFRAPSESQLFRQGSAEETVGLEPVKADNYEAGLRADLGGRITSEVSVYRLDIADDILTFFDPATGLRQATNAGATSHRGVEAALSVAPVDPVRLDAAWTWTTQSYESWRPSPTADYSGNGIELAPRNMGRAAVTVMPGSSRRTALVAEWVHLGRYWMDPANTHEYGGHDLLNLSATVPVGGSITLVGRVHNVFDTRYAETSTFNTFQGPRYRPGAPRTVYLGARYAWAGR